MLQFGWWAWLLSSQFAMLKTYKQTISPLQVSFFEEQYQQKLLMLYGEGIVFLLMLGLGFYFLLRAVSRQIEFTQRQRNFLLSITHELNSPISAIRLNLETQLARTLDPQTVRNLSADALDETRRLQDLIENLLTSARLEENKWKVELREDDLSLLVLRQCQVLARGREGRFQLEISPQIKTQMDEMAVSVMLKNLVENALKYSDGIIEIKLKKCADGAELTVRDHGKGIPVDALNRVFDRFYRSGDEQTRTTRGAGLGLYITRKLSESHHARIKAQNHPTGGAIFTIIFTQ